MSPYVQGEKISLFVEDVYEPYSLPDGSGISNAIVIAAYAEMGIEVNLVVMPFSRIISYLEQGIGLGGFNTVPTDRYSNKFVFGAEPIYVVKTSFFYHRDRPLNITSISELDDLKLLVGEVRGYMYDQSYLDLKFTHSKAESDETLLKMLMRNRFHAIYITESTVQHFISKNNYPPDVLIKLDNIGVTAAPLHVAFSRKHPKAKHYAELLDKGIRLLRKNGKYSLIVHQKL